MSIEEKHEQIRKQISLLEWDIPLLKNTKLKDKKSAELDKLKQELDKLRSSITKGG